MKLFTTLLATAALTAFTSAADELKVVEGLK